MDYDVIIAGGGVAGIAAALGARRAGAQRVLLLERQYLLGGLATCGLVTIYLPLCDGMGRQVSFSIAEELLRLSIRHGWEGHYPERWLAGQPDKETRYQVQFNPYAFAIEAEQLLRREGVDIFYGAMLMGATAADGRVQSVEIVHKSGRETLTANAFVDATGDADLCYLAGAPTAQLAQGNLLAAWYYQTLEGQNKLTMLGFCDVPDEYKDKADAASAEAKRYAGLDGRELSDMTIDSHRALYQDFLKHGGISPAHSLSTIATIPQVRMTRRLDGLTVMDDKNPYAYCASSVGLFADWRKRGAAYELPLGTLRCEALGNLYAAGRRICVTDSMWDITRVIPICAVSGQAAGVAAALTRQGEAAALQRVQAELEREGVTLHF